MPGADLLAWIKEQLTMPDGVPMGIDGMKAAEIVDRIGEYVRDCDDERNRDSRNATHDGLAIDRTVDEIVQHCECCRWAVPVEGRTDHYSCTNDDSENAWGPVEATDCCELFYGIEQLPNAQANASERSGDSVERIVGNSN
jgi:hypothetical protein